MDVKKIIKKILCPIQCIRFGIHNHKDSLYIGKACKIVNAKLMEFGKNVSIMPYTMLVCHGNESKIFFDDGVEIGMYSRVAAQSEVILEKNVLTGPHIFIADYNHEYQDIYKAIKFQGNMIKPTQEFPRGGVRIGEGTWIGTNVVIAGTIKIGKQCVIGANSVVTKDVPDYSVAVGSPCKVIRKYNLETQKWEKCN